MIEAVVTIVVWLVVLTLVGVALGILIGRIMVWAIDHLGIERW